ncbi:MAG: ABC transporter ATP-binding protein/permease [Clostridia bacterium]|nr:ABC transporter ATP-binding protein/permease [Clostridia bacterium]
MLELRDIKKSYTVGDTVTQALKGISIDFRESEFVAILGPSGCGKTTLLNVVGGLDKYDSGDLIISGRSTKEYKDSDWDKYRNHSIGFVFQSYNLIPHQTVLSNVELALSLCGVSKSERRARAKKALEDVGLHDQLYKKPSEMSGGQMQRVAIARALVNDPEIILADEPTGALDSETSLQVMDILKEVAKNRLVIMVTHNPDLADRYATRVIKMLDGEILSDSAPLSEEDAAKEKVNDAIKTEAEKKAKKPSMSLMTSFALSLKNLITKKGRTMLTSFAGSIGIIGIALIFAVSQGMTSYINTVQEDTLSSYPLTLESQHMDIGSLLQAFMGNAAEDANHEKDAVYQKAMFYNLVNSLNAMEATENDLKSFKEFLEAERSNPDSATGLQNAINGVQYTYALDLLIYTESIDGQIIHSDTNALLQELLVEYFGLDLSGMMQMNESMMGGSATLSMSNTSVKLWQEMLSGDDGKLINPLLEKQYDVIYGSWPNDYNEIVLVVDENNEIEDMALYALGLISKDDIDALANAAFNKQPIDYTTKRWTYEEICGMEFRTILPSQCFVLNSEGNYEDLRKSKDSSVLRMLYANGLDLKVVGIIRPSEDAVSAMMTGSIGYTSELTKYIIEQSKDSDAIKAQLADETTDIFTGLPFKESTGNLTDEEKVAELKNYFNELDQKQKAAKYVEMVSTPTKEVLNGLIAEATKNVSREEMIGTLSAVLTAQMGMSKEDVESYLTDMSDDEIKTIFAQIVSETAKQKYAEGIKQQLSMLSEEMLVQQLDMLLNSDRTGTDEEKTKAVKTLAFYHDEVLEFSDSTYKDNLKKLGYVDLDDPESINLYASSFEEKDTIEAAIIDYNEGKDELQKITYTDYVGLMMSSVTTIINAITYVLIAFVAISLVVSSIMIGVITLISVQERTKEIGILRAIGASKRNVSTMFNAETVMIGFASGVLGVTVTYLLCLIVDFILNALTEIENLKTEFPIWVALLLIGISIVLTLIAGIIPSRSASKKDPVVALRTE